MATAISVTKDRLSTQVGYPSEPLLAIAARSYFHDDQFLDPMVSTLQSLFDYGIVDRGYKGEVIVRLLMILAMDKAMYGENAKDNSDVREVPLKDCLEQFSRSDAPLDDKFFAEFDNTGMPKEAYMDLLKRLGLDWPDSEAIVDTFCHENAQTNSLPVLNGSICFTHFIHLSKTITRPMITHDLLRYAYRRTAAIVVEEGRRGIDKIVPLLVADDQFIGLVIQDKNRLSDTLPCLLESDETHHKVNVNYFLTGCGAEKRTFQDADLALEQHWPAILFSIGFDTVGVGVASVLQQKRLRRAQNTTTKFDFPCTVLTGLGYSNLMSDTACQALDALRKFEVLVDNRKRCDIPIAYGDEDDDVFVAPSNSLGQEDDIAVEMTD